MLVLPGVKDAVDPHPHDLSVLRFPEHDVLDGFDRFPVNPVLFDEDVHLGTHLVKAHQLPLEAVVSAGGILRDFGDVLLPVDDDQGTL